MINISVNGTSYELEDETSGWQLLEQLEISLATVVVELNREIMPRSEFVDYQLADNDQLELVTIVGGG